MNTHTCFYRVRSDLFPVLLDPKCLDENHLLTVTVNTEIVGANGAFIHKFSVDIYSYSQLFWKMEAEGKVDFVGRVKIINLRNCFLESRSISILCFML